MRKLLFILFCCGSAFAQNALVPEPPVFLGPATNPRLGANLTISFCTSAATLNNCLAGTAFAQVYADSTNGNPINQSTNPLKSDALGNAPVFYAPPGQYSYTISGAGVGTPQGPYQITVPCIPGTTCVATSANNAFTGNNTHSGTETFSGPTSIPGGTSSTWTSVNNIVNPSALTITAVQTCVTAAAAFTNGGKCLVPTGTYTGTTTLAIPANVVVECDGWDAILQFTGANTPNITLASNDILRNCKVDSSGSTGLRMIVVNGNDSALEHNWVFGAATDAQLQNRVTWNGNRDRSWWNKYDTIPMNIVGDLNGVDGFQSIGDQMVNFRTGYWFTGTNAQIGTNNSIFGLDCVSVGGSGQINGWDCILEDTQNNFQAVGTIVEASREHGIYISGTNSTTVPNQGIKVIGGSYTNYFGTGVKVNGNTTNPSLLTRQVQIIAPQCLPGALNSPQSDCVLIEEAATNIDVYAVATGAQPGVAGLNHSIEMLGLVSDAVIEGTSCANTTNSCIRMRDTNGAMNRITIAHTKGLNSSFGAVSSTSCIDFVPDNGGVGGGTNVNSDIHFYGNDCNDTQGTHTQRSTLQLVNPSNGSSVTRVDVLGVTGQGNTVGVLERPTTYTNYTDLEQNQTGGWLGTGPIQAGTAAVQGFFQAQTPLVPNFVLTATGANFGQLNNVSATSWCLGHGASATVNGTCDVTWDGTNGIVAVPNNRVALTADWTCGTGGTVASCVAATIIGSGGGIPLTLTLPLVSQSWKIECDLLVSQATAATANNWNLITATNAPTNTAASYQMGTNATAYASGVTTGNSSTTTFNIGGTWTLGAVATKEPVHLVADVQGAPASGTVVSVQLVAPTVADLVTIYRGSGCRLSN